MSKTRKLVFMALLTALELIIWVIEGQIPAPIPVPGVKLGLASVITLTAMVLLGRREAGGILLARVLLSALFAGNVSALLYSATGGAVSWCVMALLVGRFPEKLLWVVSVLGAIGHNAGQLAAAVAVTGTPALLWYGPALLAAAIVTGAFTGLGAMYLVRALKKYQINEAHGKES